MPADSRCFAQVAQQSSANTDSRPYTLQCTTSGMTYGTPTCTLLAIPDLMHYRLQQLLCEINDKLKREYKTRREVLLKRLSVTLQCFTWSPKGSDNKLVIESIVRKRMASMHNFTSTIAVYDIFCAHQAILNTTKISDQSSTDRTSGESIRRSIVIGAVPDRGGRPGDRAKMPKFKARVAASTHHHHHRGGRSTGGNRSGITTTTEASSTEASSTSSTKPNKKRGGGRVQGGWGAKGKARATDDGSNDIKRRRRGGGGGGGGV
jgi:hypothetical protein